MSLFHHQGNNIAKKGQLGRNGGASGKRRRRPRDEDENSECLLWDDEGRQILPPRADSDPCKYRTLGYYTGEFGIYLATLNVVRLCNNLIDCPKALRTLLAIIRMFWSDGCVGVIEVDRKSSKFWDDFVNEFFRYYTWDPKFATRDETKASVRGYIRDRLRLTLADDNKRADEAIATSGGTYAQQRPLYMKPGVWSRIAEYWNFEPFKKKSEAGKKARSAVKVPHTYCARSFDRRRRDYAEQQDGNRDDVVVYKDCQTRM